MQHFINTIRRTLRKIISYQPKKKMEKQMNRLIQAVRICHVTSTTFVRDVLPTAPKSVL